MRHEVLKNCKEGNINPPRMYRAIAHTTLYSADIKFHIISLCLVLSFFFNIKNRMERKMLEEGELEQEGKR